MTKRLVCLFLTLLLAEALALSLKNDFDFDFEEQGADWGGLCQTGDRQSPIEFFPLTGLYPISDIEVDLGYGEIENATIDSSGNFLKFKFDGEGFATVEGSLPNGTAINREYPLAGQINIKTPAEHLFDRQRFDLELQIVHEGARVSVVFDTNASDIDEL